MRKKTDQEESNYTEQELAEQTTAMEEDTIEEVSELEENRLKAEEYYNHMQRLKAEFDNYRKRTQKEKEEIAKYGSERIIVSLLPVLDNLERAIESSQKNKDFQSLSQGVEMIRRQFTKALEDEGLSPIETVGTEFNPNVHEALLREASDKEENIILAELQKGYYLKDKVIRPSQVKVSS